MTTFAEDIKERLKMVKDSMVSLTYFTNILTDAYEYRISELEADLENEQDLTKKLKNRLEARKS